MPTDHTPTVDQNPYNPYEETPRYRAFRDGWRARCEQRPLTANPHPFSHARLVLAWLDGWMAARTRDPTSAGHKQGFARRRDESGGRTAPSVSDAST